MQPSFRLVLPALEWLTLRLLVALRLIWLRTTWRTSPWRWFLLEAFAASLGRFLLMEFLVLSQT